MKDADSSSQKGKHASKVQPTSKVNVLGLIGMILGIVGLILAFFGFGYILGLPALVLGVLGIIFSKKNGSGKGLAICQNLLSTNCM